MSEVTSLPIDHAILVPENNFGSLFSGSRTLTVANSRVFLVLYQSERSN